MLTFFAYIEIYLFVMRLPIKVDNKFIKDSIVEIQYTSTLPHEVLIGYFFKVLDNTYKYVPQSHGIHIQLGQITQGVQPTLFFNDKIKIQLTPNSIVFNSLEIYIGWKSYQEEIEKILRQILEIPEIEFYTRVGVRYINEFPELTIKSISKFGFSFNFPEIVSDSFSFGSSFQIDGFQVNINLLNSVRIPNNNGVLSQIDIDVIKNNLKIKNSDIEDVLVILNDVHDAEKKFFFGMLQDDFFQSLNPEY